MKFYLILILALLLISPVYASIDYFTDRMNFPPGGSRQHTQTLTNNNNITIEINATIPSGFSSSATNCNLINSTFFNCVLAPNTSKYFTITSPGNCTDGTIYMSHLTSNSSFSADFIFVCISDNKITDCKVEYGHGDANYLSSDQLYISDEPATIFNLIRIWNIGSYLTPDESAKNATIKCQYERYPVRTYGRVEIDYETNQVNGTFHWDEIEGGYWFRIGVVSQDVAGKNVGDYYNVTCSNLTYQFDHHQVVAEPAVCNLEIRSTSPFSCTIVNHPIWSGRSILTITNSEEYNVYDISFDRLLNNALHTETYRQLNSGKSISYIIDNTTNYNTTIFFIPSWYINSWSPVYYTQQLNCSVPSVNHAPVLVSNIPNQNWLINTNNTNAFDLDNYFNDIDGDPLTYTYSPVANITVVINSTTNQVSFIPDINWSGSRTITFYANDSINVTPSNLVTLTVNTCGNNIKDAGEQCDGSDLGGQTCVGLGYTGGTLSCLSNCQFDKSGCTSPPSPPSGGGGGGRYVPPPPPPEEIELIKDIDLTIISYPGIINIKEDKFVVFAKVENTGNILLEGITLDVDVTEGWSGKPLSIGTLDVGENKIVEIPFENIICDSSSFVITSLLEIRLTAEEKDVSDSENIMIDIYIPELSVLTDRDTYSEGDIMRLCIIYSNINEESKEQLEFEINFLYEQDSDYIIDYLSPYSVSKDKILIVTRDYVLDNIPVTTYYTIDVKAYSYGDLFSDKYLEHEADTEVFLNGIIEDTILQRANTVYGFKYNNEQHSVQINEINENYVDITVYSSPQDFRLRLLETIFVDLDEDDISDISLTYMGLKEDKADIRIKILPKTPKELAKASASYEVGLNEKTPELEKPTIISKKSFIQKITSIFVLGLLKLIAILASIIIIVIILAIFFHFYPESYEFIIIQKNKFYKSLIKLLEKVKSDKFLNIKSIKSHKKR